MQAQIETTVANAPKVATRRSPALPMHMLSLSFDLPLYHNQIEDFRGAFADLAGLKNDLFHNHDNSTEGSKAVIYRYPRVQYRVHNGMATVMGINEGAVALNALLESNKLKHFRLNGRSAPLAIKETREVQNFKALIAPRGTMHKYRIYKWLPLNQANYTLYKAYDDMGDKLTFLESILRGHIVAFAQSMGWQLPQNRKVKVVINDLDRITKVKVLGTEMLAVDLIFSTNALLPDRLGLGRKTAYGYGWIFRFNEE